MNTDINISNKNAEITHFEQQIKQERAPLKKKSKGKRKISSDCT